MKAKKSKKKSEARSWVVFVYSMNGTTLNTILCLGPFAKKEADSLTGVVSKIAQIKIFKTWRISALSYKLDDGIKILGDEKKILRKIRSVIYGPRSA